MKILLLIPLLLLGCSIQKINKPPDWASAIGHHTRFTGIDLSYQGVGFKLGWGSDVWWVVPVSTNRVYAAPISDTFRLGQNANPLTTTITEDLQTGWEGQPPPPRLKFVVPVEKSLSTNDWPFLPWQTNLPPVNR